MVNVKEMITDATVRVTVQLHRGGQILVDLDSRANLFSVCLIMFDVHSL